MNFPEYKHKSYDRENEERWNFIVPKCQVCGEDIDLAYFEDICSEKCWDIYMSQ